MAYDEDLADRIRVSIQDVPGVSEKTMFGGLAFLVGGHMAVAASSKGGLMVRCDPRRPPRCTSDRVPARSRCGARRSTGGCASMPLRSPATRTWRAGWRSAPATRRRCPRSEPPRAAQPGPAEASHQHKWTEYDADVLPLWVAEMDVALADPVREALERAVHLGDTGYPGRNTYAEALGAFAEDRYGWSGLDPARTSLVADVMTGAMEAVKLISEAGDAVVVNPPVYPPFFGFLEATGRQVLEVPLRDGRLDLDGLAQTFADRRPAVYFLCSPHNPTGTVHTAEELAAVARLADAHHVRVVVDEIHAPLVLTGRSSRRSSACRSATGFW